MLVITQQEGEILEIGDDVRILIRRVRGGWVRMAIDAPREVSIRRVKVSVDPGACAGAGESSVGEPSGVVDGANATTHRRRRK